jgi:hypothetical protein
MERAGEDSLIFLADFSGILDLDRMQARLMGAEY